MLCAVNFVATGIRGLSMLGLSLWVFNGAAPILARR
jgi:hypothetical protein